MVVLELMGTLCLSDDTRAVPVSAQQRRPLTLLAVLALAAKPGLSRDRIEGYLWPESSGPLARHSLDQTVYAVRNALGRDVILSTGRELRLNLELVRVDAWEFEKAIRAGEWATAVGHYKGPLLDGFHIANSGELESWIDTNRARLLRDYQTAIEFLADRCTEASDHSQSVTWCRRLANSDPLSAGPTKKLMCALAAAGDYSGAVKHARLYQELVRQELEIEPDPEIERLAVAFSHPVIPEAVVPPGLEKTPRVLSQPSESFAGALDNLSKPAAKVGAQNARGGAPWERTTVYALIALAFLTSGAAIWGWVRPSPSKPVVRYTLVVDSTQAIANGAPWTGRLALSPDGSRLAYIGGQGGQLMIRPLDQLHATAVPGTAGLGATAVPGTAGVSTPFFSPDGSQVGFLEENKVWIVPTSGGLPVAVTDTLTGLAGASWGPDNFIYIDGSGWTSLLRVEAKRGAKPSWFTVLDTASGEYDHTWPEVLPNGKGVLFTVAFHGRNGQAGKTSYAIAVADIPSGNHRLLVHDALYPRYSPSGHLLYVTTNKTLMFVPFDQNSLKVTGAPSVLSEGIRLGLLGSADLAVSATGTLVYTTGQEEGTHELVWVTRDGKTQAVDPDWQGTFLYFPAISPDGKWVAVARTTVTEPTNIWIKRLDRGQSRRLTLDSKDNVGPEWAPDGKSVTFSSDVDGGVFSLWTKPTDGSAPAVLQFREKRHVYCPRWSPDRKWLVFQTDPAQSGAGDILGIRPGIDSVPVPLVVTKFTEVAPALSPDGRWLAYTSNESGQFEIYVVPFPNTHAAKWAISAAGGTEPLWSHSGRELFYRDAAQNFVAVEVKTRPTFSIERSTVLFSAARFDSYNFAPLYAVAPDDQRFMMSRHSESGTPDKLIFVENWFEELKAPASRSRRSVLAPQN